ncbi:MAG TPA: acyl-CoA dehydrogenase family protein [Acidocella sp.]|uniref:acyl-CoA dehydrogenase family protein n=1 Tax=Acidocella sp. TaxID=50710 RepID=UPI002B6AFD32|nr:acyl-CoA dehydrogenase family protein [Acidocella sp.]HVE21281.1 acyl-CoA dehydrogenase family protein [Acidocella sp.]
MVHHKAGWAAPRSRSYELLAERFQPIFRRIREGALQRETDRTLPYQPIRWLRDAGFGAVRIAAEDGGGGATLPELFALLTELAVADSNVTQALRAHFGVVEDILSAGDASRRARWLPRFVAGDLVGSAFSEGGGNQVGSFGTILVQDGARYLLNGTKYYSTGALFADWVNFGAVLDGEVVSGLALATDPGVSRREDWNGFGQILTGSGTTEFVNVPVDPKDIFRLSSRSKYRTAFFQLVHLATLSGIGRAAAEDVAAEVAARTRTYTHGAGAQPRVDPQVLQVVGRVRSLAYAAAAITLQAAEAAQRVFELSFANEAKPLTEAAIDAELEMCAAQPVVAKLILEATTLMFDALGASATDRAKALDRYWRNARTIGSHNPLIYKERIVGDFAVNGTAPPFTWMVGEGGS